MISSNYSLEKLRFTKPARRHKNKSSEWSTCQSRLYTWHNIQILSQPINHFVNLVKWIGRSRR
jgi:hypothetical protein